MINFEKLFENLSPTHYELVSKFKVKLKPLLQQALSESEFYCDLIYKFKKKKKKKKIKKCWFFWSVQKKYRTLQPYCI